MIHSSAPSYKLSQSLLRPERGLQDRARAPQRISSQSFDLNERAIAAMQLHERYDGFEFRLPVHPGFNLLDKQASSLSI